MYAACGIALSAKNMATALFTILFREASSISSCVEEGHDGLG
jgi:hypothetical protein